MKQVATLLFLIASQLPLSYDKEIQEVEASRCHIFIDYSNIWTLEVVEQFGRPPVAILNVITFNEEEQAFKPEQVQIYNTQGMSAEIEKLSIDTGVSGDPYITNYLKILPNSFIGMDLVADMSKFEEPDRVSVELGESEFFLMPVDCLDFETLAQRIDSINVNSPNIREDFDVLNIPQLGRKGERRSGRR